jgi:hypothetical protein
MWAASSWWRPLSQLHSIEFRGVWEWSTCHADGVGSVCHGDFIFSFDGPTRDRGIPYWGHCDIYQQRERESQGQGEGKGKGQGQWRDTDTNDTNDTNSNDTAPDTAPLLH